MWDAVWLAQTPRSKGLLLGREARLRKWCADERGWWVWGSGGLTVFASPRRVRAARAAAWVGVLAVVAVMALMGTHTLAWPGDEHLREQTTRFVACGVWLGVLVWIWTREHPLLVVAKRRRVRAVEDARRRVEAGETGAVVQSGVGREIRRRREAWDKRLRESQRAGAAMRFSTHRSVAMVFCCGQLAAAFVTFGVRLEPAAWGGFVCVGPAVFWASVLGTMAYAGRVRVAERVMARRCPDCGYDLGGARAGINADLLGGVDAGPRRCAECGVAWPLVPPEVGR